MIEQEHIEAIKQSVDLVALVRSRGVPLKKNGKGYKGHCPFHDDQKTPSLSVTPDKNLWQCFGCGAGGDAIRFVELFDKVDFKAAVLTLEDSPSQPEDRGQESGGRKAVKKRSPEPKPLTAAHVKLLSRVIGFYHTAFSEDPRAREYLQQRGITDNGLFSDYTIGFANGTLLNVLPDAGEIRAQLRELGILNDKGTEHFYGCVAFPLYDLAGNPAGIYGRRIEGMGEGAHHLYLPGPRRGLFNRQAATAHKEIILTEAVLDSLTLLNAGISNTIPCYGVNGLAEDHLSLFRQHQPEVIKICFDHDESGRRGQEAVAARLRSEGFSVSALALPEGQDINDFFLLTADAKERFAALLAPDNGTPAKQPVPEQAATTPDGFTLTRDGRVYEVRAISKTDKLKATVKGISGEGSKKRFHVDTVDFYSARSRSFLVRGLAELFGCEEKLVTRDLEKLTELAEQHIPNMPAAETVQEITGQDKEAALRFLHNPNLLEEIIADLETVGYTGEEMNKLLCYLAAVSRKMDEPLSVMIQSRSAAGKSCLQDTVLALMPDEDFIKYTRLTDQALFYRDGSLAHKILAIEELDGMNGAMYSIRTMQSSKKITIAYTGKDPVTGKMKTEENTVEGPLMVFITTTQAEIDGETASRFLFISIDESQAMTEKILAKQRQSHTLEGFLGKLKTTDVIRKHKNAGRLLKPLKVVNPYAELLTFTSKTLRARRDNTKYLNLIQAISYLYQYQRKTYTVDYGGQTVEYINVTLADIYRGNELAAEVLGRSLDELSPPSRKLLLLIRTMCEERAEEGDAQYTFSRRDIREYSGWSDFQVRTHIRQLEELEYIYSVTGRRGKEYVHELVARSGGEDGRPFLIGLVDMEQLRKKADELGIVDELRGPEA
jgi:DNA primase catalytic core